MEVLFYYFRKNLHWFSFATCKKTCAPGASGWSMEYTPQQEKKDNGSHNLMRCKWFILSMELGRGRRRNISLPAVFTVADKSGTGMPGGRREFFQPQAERDSNQGQKTNTLITRLLEGFRLFTVQSSTYSFKKSHPLIS